MILLAIHVGHPTVAAKVVDAIDRVAKDRTWPALLDDLVEGRVEGVMCTEREKSEIAAVASKLARVSKRVPEEPRGLSILGSPRSLLLLRLAPHRAHRPSRRRTPNEHLDEVRPLTPPG